MAWLYAADKNVEMARFDGKPVIKVKAVMVAVEWIFLTVLHLHCNFLLGI